MKTIWTVKSRLISFEFYGSKKELEAEMSSLADDIDSAGKKQVNFEVSNRICGSRQQWTVTKDGNVKN